ncbi:MAG: YjbH domain-containing protein, partial [Loktanella sp.]|nr:YjbH domain-containing protein [Loktanella sp.]
FDRSFDIQLRLIDEGRYMPAIAIGLRDFIGTGLYSSEYLVASKHLFPNLVTSVGIGWGVLGQRDSFRNPLSAIDDRFDTRPGRSDQGGQANTAQWFRGDAAAFAGLTWQVTDRLSFAADYASDTQDLSVQGLVDETSSPFNVGLAYTIRPGIVVGAQYLNGETLAGSLRLSFNPRNPPIGGDASPAPLPYARRDIANPWAGPVLQDDIPSGARIPALAAGLEAEGITLLQIAQSPTAVQVRVENNRFDAPAQAVGRTARYLAFIMPASVEQFDIDLVENGMAPVRITLQRSDLERLEFTPDFVNTSLAATQISTPRALEDPVTLPSDAFTFGISPFLGLGFFDPDSPLRADFGVEFSSGYQITPQLSVSGAVRAKLFGNRDQTIRESDSILPRVRSEQPFYDRDGTIWVERLTADHFGQLGDDYYTRVSVGYLEQMFGGVSGEVLWKPVDSRLAFGAELNYAMQRDTDKLFGFGDYDYSVWSGHVSGYYALANGFDLQVDVGRYLAGDWGTTIGIDRRFGNGWSVGAFATFTDVSFDDFGEGSFDKGLRFSVPLSWALGQPTRDRARVNLRPIQRDGGARLDVENRLYPIIRDVQAPELSAQWGRFWR